MDTDRKVLKSIGAKKNTEKKNQISHFLLMFPFAATAEGAMSGTPKPAGLLPTATLVVDVPALGAKWTTLSIFKVMTNSSLP